MINDPIADHSVPISTLGDSHGIEHELKTCESLFDAIKPSRLVNVQSISSERFGAGGTRVAIDVVTKIFESLPPIPIGWHIELLR